VIAVAAVSQVQRSYALPPLKPEHPLVWWSKARTYKNTITNALFMHVSAAMYLRHKDKPGYLQNAVNVGYDMNTQLDYINDLLENDSELRDVCNQLPLGVLSY
jgi:hypothetical protein